MERIQQINYDLFLSIRCYLCFSMGSSPVVLFDGVCNFCNYWVNFAIRHDRKKKLKFAPLQSDAGKEIIRPFNLPIKHLTSVILIDEGKAYTQSSAVFRICKYLNGGWKLFYGMIIIPKFIRDFLYNIIARNRYRWFGKKESCMMPTNEIRERFLS
jgi:predicted DCC family thiol-disulfide oxidoreductase YuxK